MKMRKRLSCVLLSLLLAGGVVGCAPFSSELKQSETYMDAFDTVSVITAYGVKTEQFSSDVTKLHDQLTAYHRLFDIYNSYPDINNLKTVNEHAGGEPVKVDSRIIDLLEYGLDAYKMTNGQVNIVFGAVLSLWHDTRTAGIADPQNATIPLATDLTTAAEHVSPDLLVIDRAAGTVRLTDPRARLDVGAIAKGYVTEQLARYAKEQLGWDSALLNIGGNIRAIGQKGRSKFTIGIQNPDTDSADPYVMTVKIADKSVVTSGDYQRYYEVDGGRYSHIIDTDTLYPATHMRAVSVICEDSGLADVLSTALFTMSVDEGMALIEKTADAEAVWLLPSEIRYSSGFATYK